MNAMDILRGIGHKLKSGPSFGEEREGKMCRSVMVNLPTAEPSDIEFKDITYTVTQQKQKKTVLKGVSGKFKCGELTAIMGPSGAGKSTLLNILTGFITTGTSGTISNTDCRKKGKKSLRSKEACYIQQDDRLCPLFTVEESMTIAADLKLGNNLSYRSKKIVIEDILDTLSLTSTKSTRCSQLSGGQRKRLSIALELIDNPPVIFLDEPTTGLDSSSTLQCVSMLKYLASRGRTIVCTIHQPSATVFSMFDHVYVLAEGMCVYEGSSSNTVTYLQSVGLNCPIYHNPADFMLEVANCEYGNFNNRLAAVRDDKQWRSEISTTLAITTNDQKTRLHKEASKKIVLISPPSEFSKFLVLLNRCVVQLYRDWTVSHLKIVLHLLVGIVLGLLFTNAGSDGAKSISNMSFMMISIVYLCYTSMMPAVLKFPQELPILKKECFNHWYSLKTYYAAVLFTHVPLQIVFVTLYCSVSYFMSDQPRECDRFLMFLTACVLITLLAEAIGYVLGTCVNAINGTFLGAIYICAMLVFAGFLVLFSHMSAVMRFISYTSFMRYGLEALLLSVYGGDRKQLGCSDEELYCHYRFPKKLLEEVGMANGNYWLDILVLLVSTIIIRIIAFITLSRTLRKS